MAKKIVVINMKPMKSKLFGSSVILMLLFLIMARPTETMAQGKERELAVANYQKYYWQKPVQANEEKEKTLAAMREQFSKTLLRGDKLAIKFTVDELQNLLTSNGQFSDLMAQEKGKKIDVVFAEAFQRLWKIADAYRTNELDEKHVLTDKFLQSILYYGNKEISRPNNTSRFHASCFSMPTSVTNIYFIFFKQMEEVEQGACKNDLLVQACTMLKTVGLQAWTQPLRNDETDNNVVQVPRFQHHVWWVGGNGLTYRPVMPVAAMLHSIPMLDVLAEVSQKAISQTSQNTNETSFWTEGFTADGAGWGHGKQCQVWAYPIDGANSALSLMTSFKGTPWAKKMSRENVDVLLNFFRNSNFYYYKGYNLPFLYRTTMNYGNLKPGNIRYHGMVDNVLKNWMVSFTTDELKELIQLNEEGKNQFIKMKGYPNGMYNGSRWFYNNDDLIKKNEDYSLFINMASSRCDGLESAPEMADAYNFYLADGMTLFQRTGQEYYSIFGGWDVTATPGVTAREGMEKLIPVTNWRGYNSKYNFAGAATNGDVNAVSGFIFEKGNGTSANDLGTTNTVNNEVLYKVKAYKANFILGDYLVALGAGVTNLNPSFPGAIRTTIDQTAWTGKVSILQDGKKIPVGNGEQSFFINDKPVWVIQKDKFAYTVLPEYTKQASFVCETKPTQWTKMCLVNKNAIDLPATAAILRLWINHGLKPVNDTYGYVVYMGKGLPAVTAPVHVLRNDTAIQAACTDDKRVIGAVFYDAKQELKTKEITLSVSDPCTVLIEEAAEKIKLSVCDAQMNAQLSKMVIILNGKKIEFTLPSGKDCGKPITLVINK
jgi:chondroitin AC lyase